MKKYLETYAILVEIFCPIVTTILAAIANQSIWVILLSVICGLIPLSINKILQLQLEKDNLKKENESLRVNYVSIKLKVEVAYEARDRSKEDKLWVTIYNNRSVLTRIESIRATLDNSTDQLLFEEGLFDNPNIFKELQPGQSVKSSYPIRRTNLLKLLISNKYKLAVYLSDQNIYYFSNEDMKMVIEKLKKLFNENDY